ncbi:short-chain dehydrogenase/reductase SDR [Arthrospira platensis C1]|nr:short-chain dehydrogenase/reductase SDR [Arthrospira platensis C1]
MTVLETFGLQDQVAIVTGGGAGIGRGIAELFAQAGAAVVVSDLKEETATAVADGIKEKGGRSIAVPCDVTKDSDLENLVQSTLDAFGKITLLINNGRGGRSSTFRYADGYVYLGLQNQCIFRVSSVPIVRPPHGSSRTGGDFKYLFDVGGK